MRSNVEGSAAPVSGDVLSVFPQLREKAVVDVVNGLTVLDDHLRFRDVKRGSFLDRLWDGLTGASARQQQAVDRGMEGVLLGLNGWLQGLQAAQAESDIALGRVAERLLETRKGVMKLQTRYQELQDAVATLDQRLTDHIESTEDRLSDLQQELRIESARSRAADAVAEVAARWRNPRYGMFPPLLRLMLAGNDLYWGKFGAFLRLKGRDDGDAGGLIDHARNVLANLASDFAAGEEPESLIVDHWLDPLGDATLPTDWRDAIVYLLEDASQEFQPLAVSARIRLQGSKEELPRNRPRLVQPSWLGELVMRETVQRIETEGPNKERLLR